MKKYKFTINGNNYDTSIVSVEDNIATVEVNGSTFNVEVDKSIVQQKTPRLIRQRAIPSTDSHPSVAKTSSPSGPKGAGNIKSPLPGVILEIFVREGDTVKMGQKLLLLEAMKMENNIEADRAGKIISIPKGKGDAVMEGDILIVIGE